MAHFSFAGSGNDRGRQPYTTYIDHKVDPCCRIEFFFDGILHKIASIFQIAVHLVEAFCKVGFSHRRHDRVLAQHWGANRLKTRYTSGSERVPSALWLPW
jgi:hypothetical protein